MGDDLSRLLDTNIDRSKH